MLVLDDSCVTQVHSKGVPIQRRRAMMNSGVIPVSSSRTQAQTRNEWAEYLESSASDVFGWIASTA